VSDLTVSRAFKGSGVRTALTAAAAVIFVLWTMAAVFTLVYWSGLVLWIAGAIALVGFVWILKVYLRPRVSPPDT
jgi:hypothetical protein